MSGKHGFTYTAVLVLIVITGIAATSAKRSWSTIIKREKEQELLFRGDQIRQAIASYYNSQENRRVYPASLKDLIKDPRYMGIKRHLRRIYTDPMTESNQWGLVYAQGGGIKGVFSINPGEPLKKSNFDTYYGHFKDKLHYYDWKFVYQPE